MFEFLFILDFIEIELFFYEKSKTKSGVKKPALNICKENCIYPDERYAETFKCDNKFYKMLACTTQSNHKICAIKL